VTAEAQSAPLSSRDLTATKRAQRPLALTWRRFCRHRLALASAVFLVLLVAVAVLAPWITPYDPNATDLNLARFGRPAAPSLSHPMGSDQLGRDWLSRLIAGSRVSLVVGFLATGVAIVAGTLLGAIAGYAGRWVDTAIMRVCDLMLAFPPLLFLMGALTGIRSPTVGIIALVIAVIGWMNVARLVRAEFLTLRTREFTIAARAVGASTPSIIFRHLLPNAVGPIIVAATLGIPAAILTESTLSFLGFGIQPPTASWGNMLQGSFNYMRDYRAWWMGFYPGLLISLTVLAFNFLGDGLRDALDPYAHR